LEHPGQTRAFLDRQTVLPLRLAVQGVRFRILLTRQEATQGVLCLEPAFQYSRPQKMAPQDMQLLDAAGRPIAVRAFTQEVPAIEIGDWYRTHRIRRNDSILVTIEDWERGCFRLGHEPANRRRQQDIVHQNQELAKRLFDMIEAARDGRINTH